MFRNQAVRFHKALARAGIVVSPQDVDEWVSYDESSPISAEQTEDDMIAEVTSRNDGSDADDDTDGVISTDGPVPAPAATQSVPSAADAVKGLETALLWLETRNIDCVKIMQIRNMLVYSKRAVFEKKQQRKVTDFFKRAS